MATKPTETFTWATATNHATGPQAGNATKVSPPGHPTNTTGFTPGTGIIPEYENLLFNILGEWTGWLGSGSSAGAADAHIVETDANGDTAVQALSATAVSAGTVAASTKVNTPLVEVATRLAMGGGTELDARLSQVRLGSADESSTTDDFVWPDTTIVRYTGDPATDNPSFNRITNLPSPTGKGLKVIVSTGSGFAAGATIEIYDPSTATRIAEMDWSNEGALFLYSDGTNWKMLGAVGSAFSALGQY